MEECDWHQGWGKNNGLSMANATCRSHSREFDADAHEGKIKG